MITRPWHSFKLHLPSLASHMGGDGILADSLYFTVFVEDTEENQQKLDVYLASLTEAGELIKLNYLSVVSSALLAYKYTLLAKKYSEMSELDRSIILGLPLTDEQISSIVSSVS